MVVVRGGAVSNLGVSCRVLMWSCSECGYPASPKWDDDHEGGKKSVLWVEEAGDCWRVTCGPCVAAMHNVEVKGLCVIDLSDITYPSGVVFFADHITEQEWAEETGWARVRAAMLTAIAG